MQILSKYKYEKNTINVYLKKSVSIKIFKISTKKKRYIFCVLEIEFVVYVVFYVKF